jgi:hypothetical protein
MNEYETKPCGWKIDHPPHHIEQRSTESFNCPGYSVEVELEQVLTLAQKLPSWNPEVKW